MAETQNQDEPSLPTKRKHPEDQPDQSLQNGSNDDLSEEDENDDDFKLDDEKDENPKAVVDKKGKGIMIEREKNSDSDDEDDDDVSSDDDDDSDGDEVVESSESEEEDPLAEVDLENILPSRTRRKVSHGGVCIKDAGVNGSGRKPEEDEFTTEDQTVYEKSGESAGAGPDCINGVSMEMDIGMCIACKNTRKSHSVILQKKKRR